jgi:hypothetical protein
MFSFLSAAPYEQRKVANTKVKKAVIDTCAVNDSTQNFETGIVHPQYNNGSWIIVEQYDTEEQSRIGHNKWVKLMKAKNLPQELKDVSTSGIALFISDISDNNRHKQKRIDK